MIPRIPFPLWLNGVPSLENICQALLASNEYTDLQPILSKGAGDASLTIFVTDCLQNYNKD